MTAPIRKSQQQRQQKAQARKRLLIKVGGGVSLLLAVIWGLRQLPWYQWWLQLQPEETAQADEGGATPPKTQADQANKKPVAQSPVEFSFYKALPKMAVEVDVAPLPVKLKQPVVIIAGTFSRSEAAQRELVRLQKKGFTQLQVKIFERHGRTLYQLRSKPLDNKLDVIRLRNRLEKAGIEVMVVKLTAPQPVQSSQP